MGLKSEILESQGMKMEVLWSWTLKCGSLELLWLQSDSTTEELSVYGDTIVLRVVLEDWVALHCRLWASFGRRGGPQPGPPPGSCGGVAGGSPKNLNKDYQNLFKPSAVQKLSILSPTRSTYSVQNIRTYFSK